MINAKHYNFLTILLSGKIMMDEVAELLSFPSPSLKQGSREVTLENVLVSTLLYVNFCAFWE